MSKRDGKPIYHQRSQEQNVKKEIPNEAEALWKASRMISLPWFRALVDLADQVNERNTVDVDEVSVSISIDEVGDDRGDVITWSRVEGFAWVYGNNVEGCVKRTVIQERESNAQN